MRAVRLRVALGAGVSASVGRRGRGRRRRTPGPGPATRSWSPWPWWWWGTPGRGRLAPDTRGLKQSPFGRDQIQWWPCFKIDVKLYVLCVRKILNHVKLLVYLYFCVKWWNKLNVVRNTDRTFLFYCQFHPCKTFLFGDWIFKRIIISKSPNPVAPLWALVSRGNKCPSTNSQELCSSSVHNKIPSNLFLNIQKYLNTSQDGGQSIWLFFSFYCGCCYVYVYSQINPTKNFYAVFVWHAMVKTKSFRWMSLKRESKHFNIYPGPCVVNCPHYGV